MKRLILVVTCLLFIVISSIARELLQVDVFGKLIPVTTYSNIKNVVVYCDGESLDVHFNIALERVGVEILSLDANNSMYSCEINSAINQNLIIDISDLPEGEYKIQFINLNSGDIMYGLFLK